MADAAMPAQGNLRKWRPGTWTLQLVLDQGAWEEVLTIDADDADNLQDLLSTAKTVHFDVQRQTLMFGTVAPGDH